LISIMLLGIGAVSLMMGLATAIRAGDSHRQLAEADTALVQVVTAAVDANQLTYLPCATAAQYNSAMVRPSGWGAADLSVTAVQYWNGSGFQAGCLDNDANAGTYARLQQLTIKAINPKGRGTHTITVVKRGS
jgi:hypothetical protein